MGLGKTVITLTALKDLLFDSFEVSKILIIAPLRVARDTWREEIDKWDHLDILEYEIAIGTEKERLKEMKKFLEEKESRIDRFDDVLVRKLIEGIEINGNTILVEFKSGIKIEVK
ncbi:SNF2-related protein [Helcococcus kunzii]|uniref:SNF2-related protein n=1 Tax=Helcococcus kunzii TaxID=40091 RepID=UPI0036F22C2A